MKARGIVISRRNGSATVFDWKVLQPGDRVEVMKNAQVVGAGEVEEVSPSGTVLWLAPAALTEKQLYLKSGGVQIRRC